MVNLIHLDTSQTSTIVTSEAIVSKVNNNPFQCSIQLGDMYRNIREIELSSAEIPQGFNNIRDPFNTFIINGTTYVVPPGNYTIYTLMTAMSVASGFIFQIVSNRVSVTLPSSGGTITYSGGITIHTITTVGTTTVSVPSSVTAQILIVGGGGAGGSDRGGGGGAGGYVYYSSVNLYGVYSVVVGGGGIGTTSATGGGTGTVGGSGGNSSVSGLTVAIGGGGGGGCSPVNKFPTTGGSGGGGSHFGGSAPGASGVAGQGNAGGNGYEPGSGGGGGGASSTGANAASTVGGNGGAGTTNSISGSAQTYCGGGGGGVSSGGTVGSGGGGGGSGSNSGNGNAATYYGGGGGGGTLSGGFTVTGGNGYQGIVIISYPSPAPTVTVTTPNSLLSFLGFVNGQSSVTATNPYIFPFDDYLNIWIENVGPSSQEPQRITYKIPVTPGTIYWANNNTNKQIVKNRSYDFPFSKMNIFVLDRFGNQLDNNGQDWSFSIKI